jgi:hypothetical protein
MLKKADAERSGSSRGCARIDADQQPVFDLRLSAFICGNGFFQRLWV